ncbi:MAG: J domain-containing protein [Fimbriimonadaceae bacterium]
MSRPYDPYQVLGISRGSSQDQIRRAFRKAALTVHPDRNPDPQAADRFMEVRAAFDALRDPRSREVIDRELKAAEATATKATEPPAPVPPRPKSAPKAKNATDFEWQRLQGLVSSSQIFGAEWYARQLLDKYPKDARLHVQLGDLLVKHREWARASKCYVIAVQLDPRNKQYLERYEAVERKRELFATPPSSLAVAAAVLAFGVAATALVAGIIGMGRVGPEGVNATFVAMLTLVACGLLSGVGLRLLRLSPLYPSGGPKAWLGTGLAISFLSAAVAYPVQKVWAMGKSTSYPGFKKLLIACSLTAALVALFQPQNPGGALATLLFGSGVMFTGIYLVTTD